MARPFPSISENGLHARRRLNRTFGALLPWRRLSPGEAVWCARTRALPATPLWACVVIGCTLPPETYLKELSLTANNVNSPGNLLLVQPGCSSKLVKVNPLLITEFIISLSVYLLILHFGKLFCLSLS